MLRAADLAYNLPAGSASWQVIDSPAAWTVNDYLNAALYDSFAMFCWGMGDEKTRGPQPTPLPRPGEHGTPDRHGSSGRYRAMSAEEYDTWREQRFRDVKADTHMPRSS
ncbi:MAG: hypothetical protein LKI88_00835 [Bifidobacterium sp.]|nr:hypothetical protein [Bifidobacterium sp.]MCI1864475.1 hypothetical protein [Bifidobacterium sp.]